MSLDTTMLAIEDEIESILTDMVTSVNLQYFMRVRKGRLQPVDFFPSAFFWADPTVPMGNDYLDGDLIKQKYIIAGYDYNLVEINDYELAEARSRQLANDLRDEFTKWEHRNLSGNAFQAQVIDLFIDPGVAPIGFPSGGLMAAGGVTLLVTYRQNRGS